MEKLSLDEKRMLIEPNHSDLSVTRQCELLVLPRSCWYYRGSQDLERQSRNEDLMKRIERLFTAHPHLGVRSMTALVLHYLEELPEGRLVRAIDPVTGRETGPSTLPRTPEGYAIVGTNANRCGEGKRPLRCEP